MIFTTLSSTEKIVLRNSQFVNQNRTFVFDFNKLQKTNL